MIMPLAVARSSKLGHRPDHGYVQQTELTIIYDTMIRKKKKKALGKAVSVHRRPVDVASLSTNVVR